MKNIFASRTVWVNALTIAASVAGYIPPKYGVPVLAIVNIGLRLLTSQPVSILPQPE